MKEENNIKVKIFMASNIIAILLSIYKMLSFNPPYTDIWTFFVIRLYSHISYLGVLVAYSLLSAYLILELRKKKMDAVITILSIVALFGILGTGAVFLE